MRTLKVVAILVLALCAVPSRAADGQTPNGALDQIITKVVAREQAEMNTIRQYSPLVETYIQNLKNDKADGWQPNGDTYFMGRAQLAKGVELESLNEEGGVRHGLMGGFKGMFSFGVEFLPRGFLQMIYMDTGGIDRGRYNYDYVRREFLGEVRCLVFDVTPLPKSPKGSFVGRIWVEDQNYTVVRFNGAYTGSSHSSIYFHFDSWRV